MENQKAAGRSGKYAKPEANDSRSRKASGKPVRKGNSDRKPGESQTTLIRLNRFIANSGVCSRRDADEHIKNGLITVNGSLVTDLGTKVTYDDAVSYTH